MKEEVSDYHIVHYVVRENTLLPDCGCRRMTLLEPDLNTVKESTHRSEIALTGSNVQRCPVIVVSCTISQWMHVSRKSDTAPTENHSQVMNTHTQGSVGSPATVHFAYYKCHILTLATS